MKTGKPEKRCSTDALCDFCVAELAFLKAVLLFAAFRTALGHCSGQQAVLPNGGLAWFFLMTGRFGVITFTFKMKVLGNDISIQQ